MLFGCIKQKGLHAISVFYADVVLARIVRDFFDKLLAADWSKRSRHPTMVLPDVASFDHEH